MSEYRIMDEALRGNPLEDVFIIDSHGHLDFWKKSLNSGAGPDRIVESLDRLGVDMACVNNWNFPDVIAGNDNVHLAVKKYPDRFVGFAATAPSLGRDFNSAELRRCFDELGFSGVKVHAAYETLPLRDTAGLKFARDGIESVWEFCEDRKCPVLCHGFLTPDVARGYPGAKFIAAHAGGRRDYTEAYGDCPNVFFDTSNSTTLRGNIEHFVSCGMEDRVLYGSDLPYASQPYRLGQVVSSRVPDGTMRKILGGNASRLLGIVIPARYSRTGPGPVSQ